MSMWAVGTMVVLKAYEGYQARQGADRDADAIEDTIPSTILAAKANKKIATQKEYSETLSSKDIIAGEIGKVRTDSKLASDQVLTETGGSGVLADTGSTLDVQMAVLNEGRKNEAGLLAQMSIEKARNSWEALQERRAIDRHLEQQLAQIRANAKSVRQGGRDAQSQALTQGVIAGIGKYGEKGGFSKRTPIADKATLSSNYRKSGRGGSP